MILSIIIPAYNAGKYLESCLESCLDQDLGKDDYEVIIVNDGSSDDTLVIAQKWKASHKNITVISQENKGLSEARNTGISHASGTYIMFVDSDDLIAENCIGKLADICKTERPDMLRFCSAQYSENNCRRNFSYSRFTDTVEGRSLLGTRFKVCAPFAIYRRQFLKDNDLDFHPGIFHEDNEFTPKAYYFAEKVTSIDDIIYFVRQTPGSITRTANPKKSHDLLKVICLLSDFSATRVEDKYRKYFEKQISDCINVCMKNMLLLDPDDKEKLKRIIMEDKTILAHFLKSSAPLHKIEGLLLNLFPSRMLDIYKILDLIHR